MAPAAAPEQPYAPTAADKAGGFVVYLPPIDAPFAGRAPATSEVRDAVEVRAARGECEPFPLAVHALKPLGGLAWATEGPMPSGVKVSFHPVVMAPMARRRSDTYGMTGLWLADGGTVDLKAGEPLRVRVPYDEPVGQYSMSATIDYKNENR